MTIAPQDSIFYGDKRVTLHPQNAPAGTSPTKIRRGLACFLTRAFSFRGESYHSGAGATMWVIITYCIERDIPYEIVRFEDEADGRNIGYTIRRKQ